MGMTIDEATKIFRKEIECLSHTKCEDCILEKACDPMNTTPFDTEYIEAYGIAIETMRKYKKIEEIVEHWACCGNPSDSMIAISEVLEDGKID